MLAILTCACAPAFAPTNYAARNHSAFVAEWDEYVLEAKAGAPRGLQADCVPRRYAATGTFMGTAVLFHGYSACPQQYFGMARLLSAQGYDVILPLNPGHGNALSATPNKRQLSSTTKGMVLCLSGCDGGVDDVDGLPTEPGLYASFVDRINGIMALSTGVRIVAGLSVGASLAAAAGEAIDSNGAPMYSRQLIMSPMLRLHKWINDDAVTVLNDIPIVRSMYTGWPGCYVERETGRAGFCSFQIANGVAARDFGLSTLKRLKAPRGTTVTVLYDNADDVVSTAEVRKLAGTTRSSLDQQGDAGPRRADPTDGSC